MSPPTKAEIVVSLRAMLEERTHEAPRRTSKLGKNWGFPDSACTDDLAKAWRNDQDFIAPTLRLIHPRPDFEVMDRMSIGVLSSLKLPGLIITPVYPLEAWVITFW